MYVDSEDSTRVTRHVIPHIDQYGHWNETATFEEFTEVDKNKVVVIIPSYCTSGSTGGNKDKATVPTWVWLVVVCGVCAVLGILFGFYIGHKKGQKVLRDRRPRRSAPNDNHGGYNTALLDLM